MNSKSDLMRCEWAQKHELERIYHDTQWGVPVYDDQKLFEMLCLESAQAGLSWLTVLKKVGHYKKAFNDFNIEKVASFTEKNEKELLQNKGIIRNKLKIKGDCNLNSV